jgi:hypothetical protein
MDRKSETGAQRVLTQHEPGVWIGAIRRAFGPFTQVVSTAQGDTIENHPPHYLVALWTPLRPDEAFLRRWPDTVAIALHDQDRALQELLRNMPLNARLWVTLQEIDWAVIAEIAMLSEGEHFEPEHYRELERFIEQERAATLATISANYTDREYGFEGFLGTLQTAEI